MIILLAAAWRLSSGPISLAFLSPYIEQALNADRQSFRIRLDDTILTWAGWERTLDVRALNVRAVGADGRVIASAPELSLSLSGKALMRGILAPESIEVFRPKLRLLRRRDGSFQVSFDIDKGDSGTVFNRVLLGMLSPPDPARNIGYLARFNIIDADLTIEDRGLGTSWKAPATHVMLRRDQDGIRGEVFLKPEVEGQQAEINVLGAYKAATRRLDLEIEFSEAIPAVFARISPLLKPLGAFGLPLEGTVTLSMTVDGTVDTVGFDLTGGAGQVVVPAPLSQTLEVAKVALKGRYAGDPKVLDIDELFMDLGAKGSLFVPAADNHELPLRSVRARVRYRADARRLDVAALDLDLQGPTASVTGQVEDVDGKSRIRAKGVMRNLAVNDFARYWPRTWGTLAREWSVANLSDGVISEFRAGIELSADGRGGYKLVSAKGDFDFSNLTIDYLAPMPKVRKTRGTALFTEKRLDFRVTHAEAAGLKVTRGTINLTGLDQVDQFADVDLVIDGPVKDQMRLVDHEPLRLASTVGMTPATMGGTATTHLKLHFILERALSRDQVRVSATSRMRDVVIAGSLLGRSIRDGRLDLKVDKKGLDVSGEVKLGTIPVALAWRRNFADKAPFRVRYRLKGRVTEDQRVRELGLDFAPFSPDFVTGPAGVRLRVTVQDDDRRRVEATIDLADVALAYPAMGWRKDAGVGGTAEIDVNMKGDRVVSVPSFAVAAGDLTIAGSARFTASGAGLERIDFKRVSYGRTDAQGTLIAEPDGAWTATFHGASFDLEPMFEDLVRSGTQEAPEEAGPRYSLSANFDRVWLGPDRFLRKVVGSLAHDGDRWRFVRLHGLVTADKRFAIRIEPAGEGTRGLSIQADDAGAALRTLGFYENMIGGTLKVTGKFADTQPGEPLSGRVTIKNYRIIKAPVLTRLVTILALTGVVDALRGEGLRFNTLDAPFVLTDGVAKVSDAKITGLSLGYTVAGTIDIGTDAVDLKGTLVPAYVINSALGRIPVLGKLFTGGEKGGGVFAAAYTMTGPMDDPEVAVNPLSVLAPGFFRNIFQIFGQGKATSELPEETDDSINSRP